MEFIHAIVRLLCVSQHKSFSNKIYVSCTPDYEKFVFRMLSARPSPSLARKQLDGFLDYFPYFGKYKSKLMRSPRCLCFLTPIYF
jgi:hypothetical protein